MAAAASSSGVFLSMREGDDSQQTNQLGHHLQAPALPASSSQPQNPAPKRRRNQPGTPSTYLKSILSRLNIEFGNQKSEFNEP